MMRLTEEQKAEKDAGDDHKHGNKDVEDSSENVQIEEASDMKTEEEQRKEEREAALEKILSKKPRRDEIEMLIIGKQRLYRGLFRGLVLNGVVAVIQAIGAVRAAAYEQAGTEQGEEQQRLTAQLIFIHKHGDDECH